MRSSGEHTTWGTLPLKKTIEILRRQYWMPDMVRRVEHFIKNCISCILGTRKKGKQEGFLKSIVKEDTPFETIHVDHIRPLKHETRKRYQHLLVLVDSFTKFVWIFPTKSTGAAEVLRNLRVYQQNFGNPRTFITDQGSAFTSKEFGQY